MNHDWYAAFAVSCREDIDSVIRADGRYQEVEDVTARAVLLATAFGVRGRWPDAQGRPDGIEPRVYAQVGERGQGGLRGLIHQREGGDAAERGSLGLLRGLGIISDAAVDGLPGGSFYIRVPITLVTPWLSRGDVGLYAIDNPVRKDWVFGVPTISPAGWKGMLRWAATKVCLEPLANHADQFARERLALTHLFGSEKGSGEGEVRALAKYLDEICPAAGGPYRAALGLVLGLGEDVEEDDAPSVRGRLHFLPTFFDRSGMEVLNPHDRRTGAGTVPIYMECVPKDATGAFEVVYVPWAMTGGDRRNTVRESIENMRRVVLALRALCLDFGISAKRSSGYGLVHDEWPAARGVFRLVEERRIVERTFDSFTALARAVEQLAAEGADD